MTDLFFWKNWPKAYRILYNASMALCTLALLFYIIQLISGVDSIIDWQTGKQLQAIPIQLDTFTQSLFNFSIDTQTYFVTEQFVASPLQVNTWAFYILLFFLTAGFLLILSLLTELPRFWYVAGMGIFILLLASFKLDLLQVFGLRNNTFFIGTVVLYAGLSYYFHAFRTDVSMPERLLYFTLLTLLIALLLIFFSRINYSVLSLTGNGIIIPVIVSVVFIVMISHEIMNGFLYLITQSGGIGGRNSLLHFSLVSLIYIANIGIAYAHNAGFIDWDILYINAFYLYLISLLLGIWGFRKISILFEHIISFNPYGAFLYLALATISTATIGYFFATGNDSMLEMLEDIIIFSHLAMGFSFFIYVFINFRTLMKQSLPVHKVIFQPKQYPFFIARGVSLLIMLALFFRANMFPLYQSMAGYYNVIGDVHSAQQENILAEQYYRIGLQYDFQNHKSNYAVASLARLQDDDPHAVYYLKQALLKNPSAYAYGSLSNIYLDKGLFFDAVFNLQKGVKAFPYSGELYNNLALLYSRSNILDSAYIYHQLANEYMRSHQETGQTNMLAFWIKNNTILDTDSLLKETANGNHLSLQANRLALANMKGLASEKFLSQSLPADTILTDEKFTYLYNYALNRKSPYDTTLAKFFSYLRKKEENTGFSEDLRFAEACYEYYKNDRARAIDLVVGLSVNSPARAAYFSKVAGLWFLQQQAPRRALEFFEQAIKSGDSSISIQTNQAIALSTDNQWVNALAVWQDLALNADADIRTLAKQMEAVSGAILVGQPAFAANSLDENGKTLLTYFSKNDLLPEVALSITNPEYRVQALARTISSYIEKDSIVQAETLLNTARNSSQLNKKSHERLNIVSMELLLARKEYQALLTALKSTSISEQETDKKLYWQAIAYEQTKNYKQAAQFYRQALKRLPLHTELVIRATRFYHTIQKKPDLAYSVLLESTRLNPFDVNLQKAYILQCLDMQLLAYAENAMIHLQEISAPTDYQAFLPVFEARKSSVEKQLFEWK